MTDENLSKQVCKIFSQPLPYKFYFGATVKFRFPHLLEKEI